MVGGLQLGRSALHLAQTFELADQAGLLTGPGAGRLPAWPDLPAHQRGGRMSDRQWLIRVRAAVAQQRHHQEAGPCRRPSTAASAPASRRIGLWRDRVAEVGLDKAARLIRDAGLRVSTLCRGGFLTAADAAGRPAGARGQPGRDRRGRGPGHPASCSWWSAGCRRATEDSSAARRARRRPRSRTWCRTPPEHGVRLVLEPLHPMYAADRAVVSTLGQALDLAAPHPTRGRGRRRRHLPRLVGPGPAGADRPRRPGEPDRHLPGLRLQPAARRGRPAVPRA